MSKEDLFLQNNLFLQIIWRIYMNSDVFIITVPTPIDKFKKPDLECLN